MCVLINNKEEVIRTTQVNEENACAEGGYHLPIARTPPAVHPGMTIWGVKGGFPFHSWPKSYFFCYLEWHAKIQNHR